MTDTPKHSVSVAAAIFDESGKNVFLIKRRDNGHWEPPGGVLELHETIDEGLRREVREETGAQIQVGSLTGVYKNMSRGVVALVFRCTLSSEGTTPTAEAQDSRWFRLTDLPRSMSRTFVVRINDACSAHRRPAVRSHTPPQQMHAQTKGT